jgi:hypothetical protein
LGEQVFGEPLNARTDLPISLGYPTVDEAVMFAPEQGDPYAGLDCN